MRFFDNLGFMTSGTLEGSAILGALRRSRGRGQSGVLSLRRRTKQRLSRAGMVPAAIL